MSVTPIDGTRLSPRGLAPAGPKKAASGTFASHEAPSGPRPALHAVEARSQRVGLYRVPSSLDAERGLSQHGFASHRLETTADLLRAASSLGAVICFVPRAQVGLSLIHDLRGQGFEGSVMVVPERILPGDEAEVMDAGATDCLVEPVDWSAIAARIRRDFRLISHGRAAAHERVPTPQLECREPAAVLHARLTYGPVELDLASRIVCVAGQACSVRPTGYQILVVLLTNKGMAFDHRELARRAGCSPDERAVRKHVETLREALGDAGWIIETIYGVGYGVALQHAREGR